MDIRNISTISQNAPQALDSVTGGLVASVDAKGIGAVQTGIDAFSRTGFDQAVLTGAEKPIAAEAASFSSPTEYLQQIPQSGSPQVLHELEDPHFKYTEALSSMFKNVFGDGGVNDVANQVGMAPASQTSANDPGSVGDPHAAEDGSSGSGDAGDAAGGPSAADADHGKLYTGAGADINPLRSAIQLSDLTGAPSKPGDSVSDDGSGGGVTLTDTHEGGGKMPDPEAAARIDITDTGETAGEIIWQDDSEANPLQGAFPRRFPEEDANPLESARPYGTGEDVNPLESARPYGTAENPAQSQFFLNLFQNNFSKLQTMGGTLENLLTMQQDLLNRQ